MVDLYYDSGSDGNENKIPVSWCSGLGQKTIDHTVRRPGREIERVYKCAMCVTCEVGPLVKRATTCRSGKLVREV